MMVENWNVNVIAVPKSSLLCSKTESMQRGLETRFYQAFYIKSVFIKLSRLLFAIVELKSQIKIAFSY